MNNNHDEILAAGLDDPQNTDALGKPEIHGETKRPRGKGSFTRMLVYGGLGLGVLFVLGAIFTVVKLSQELKGEEESKVNADQYTVRASGLKLPDLPPETETPTVTLTPPPAPEPQEERKELPKIRDLSEFAFNRTKPQRDLHTIKPKEKPLTRQEKILASPMMADSADKASQRASAPHTERELNARGGRNFGDDKSNVDYRPVAQANKNEFSENLVAVKTAPSSASLITPQERHLTIAKGTAMECVLNTKINTTVPGLVSCTLARDVYSMDGRVRLLDAGSTVTGEYTGAVANGLERIFVLWTEIITPDGVSLELNSPAAGALGEAGVGGQVDFHWWRRFGSALLFSLISDSFEFAINSAQSNTTNGDVTYENTEDGMTAIIQEAMRQSGNIPPTLIKNQGETVMIMTARHMSFRDVYKLEAH